jgi:hypothetical protein
MINWTEYTVKQEQHRDRLRKAEKRRLIQQVTANHKPSRIRQVARNLVLRIARQRPARAQLVCQARTRPAQKA